MNISGIQREQAKSRSTFSESWVKVSAQRGPRAASQQEGYSSQARVSENGIVIGRQPHLACRRPAGARQLPRDDRGRFQGELVSSQRAVLTAPTVPYADAEVWPSELRDLSSPWQEASTKQAFSGYKWICVSDSTRNITWSFAFFFSKRGQPGQSGRSPCNGRNWIEQSWKDAPKATGCAGMRGRVAHCVGERGTVFASRILKLGTCASIFSPDCELLLRFASNLPFSRSSQSPSRAPGSPKGSWDGRVNGGSSSLRSSPGLL